jgi:hypothetical protein
MRTRKPDTVRRVLRNDFRRVGCECGAWVPVGVRAALELVGVCIDAGEEEGGRENAERRMESPSRVEGTCTPPAPEAGKLGPAERPERRLTSWRPFVMSESPVVVDIPDVGLGSVDVGVIWVGD